MSKPAESKIYFYVYPSAFQNIGGGEVLLLKTKEYLDKLGASVRLFDMWQDKFKEGDVLHVFGSVKEALPLMEVAKSKRVTIVHSPIIWYNWQSSLHIAYGAKERLLCLLRQTSKTLFPQIPSARKRMMETADAVVAGSQAEADQIKRYFLIPEERIHVITYGVDPIYESASPHEFENRHGFKNFVLCVGRIEPRKNQLQLIRALKGSGKTLVLIGDPVSHHTDYYDQCKNEADANTHFLGGFPKDSAELKSAFAAANVFALPTWFETPGLSAMEAALSGAKVVITREGATREYFGEFAEYVDPANTADIRSKIEISFNRPKNTALKEHMKRHFLWDHTAKKTLELYRKLGFQGK